MSNMSSFTNSQVTESQITQVTEFSPLQLHSFMSWNLFHEQTSPTLVQLSFWKAVSGPHQCDS